MTTIPRTSVVTDRRTNGQTTCHGNTALSERASRGINNVLQRSGRESIVTRPTVAVSLWRLRQWLSPGAGCKEQLAHGCYATARGRRQRWKWIIFRDPWPMWPITQLTHDPHDPWPTTHHFILRLGLGGGVTWRYWTTLSVFRAKNRERWSLQQWK